jgi:polysaccharide export outer membrane protein
LRGFGYGIGRISGFMRKIRTMLGVVIVGAAACSACAGAPEISAVGAPSVEAPVAALPPAGGGMTLEAGDKIRLTVFGEEKLSGEYEIDPSGFLSLPLAGTLKASGQTKIELERTVADKLRSNYLKDPKVTVDVVTFRPIYVLGEVQKPGEYAYRSGLNVVSALAVAGGSTYRASHSSVMIQRFGQPELKEYELDPSVPVFPGDVIRLPERYF